MLHHPTLRVLLGIPVYNEQRYVTTVLDEVRRYADDILVVDDGSTDETPMLLARQPVEVIRHAENRGYGRSMQDMLRWAEFDGFDWLITMDCDEQHEPASIPDFLDAIRSDEADVISGSRYRVATPLDAAPPGDRRHINRQITDELNTRLGLTISDAFCGFKAYRVSACERLGLTLTDGFCGFKAHRVSSLRHIRLTETGYAFPMQLWVQCAAAGLRIGEIPVSLIYNDASRSFGGGLDVPEVRLNHYRKVMHCELERCADRLPAAALDGVSAGCRCQ